MNEFRSFRRVVYGRLSSVGSPISTPLPLAAPASFATLTRLSFLVRFDVRGLVPVERRVAEKGFRMVAGGYPVFCREYPVSFRGPEERH